MLFTWISNRKIAALEQQGDFIGIDLVVFCFATMNGFQV
jgi:hypothetical protein